MHTAIRVRHAQLHPSEEGEGIGEQLHAMVDLSGSLLASSAWAWPGWSCWRHGMAEGKQGRTALLSLAAARQGRGQRPGDGGRRRRCCRQVAAGRVVGGDDDRKHHGEQIERLLHKAFDDDTTMASSGDRLSQLKAFDDTKAGVKGLVDAGVAAVPPIFHHPPDPHAVPAHAPAAAPAPASSIIPVVDLAAAANDRAGLVAQVREAAETLGFFQVINHGLPAELLAETLASVTRFNEEPPEAKRPYYSRDPARRVRYQSNFDLFHAPAASWRDTLFLELPAPEEEIPPACRGAVPEYARRARGLGAHLLELLSEALGLHAGYLEHDAGCLDGGGVAVGCHYYPPCPEPHLTLGTAKHSDPSFLTVLLQDGVGGLQVLVGGRWVDLPPVPGALVVNVGDLLQLVSNDRFKSVEHRVVATSPAAGARVSAACFFRTTGAAASTRAYGPIATLTPPRYRSVTMAEFLGYYKGKGLDGRSALDRFRLPSSDDPCI